MSITVYCPSCKTRLTVDDDRAHDEFPCPECDEPIRAWALKESPPAAEPEQVAEVKPRRSRRRDDEDYEEEERPRKRRGRRNRGGCPYCGYTGSPARGSRISQAGWITFAVLLLLCWPLCFIGLFMKEDYPVCYDCGRGLG
ncbi:MAG: hypothetical protein L0241_24150 [Planctomycetia bacterium]|nr:hypothetical protein [Planctomycetia bacterium]